MGKGLFVSLEGPDGAGKSTLIRRLAAKLRASRLKPIVTREPGGSPLAEKIRGILLARSSAALTTRAEVLLFEAARSQHLAETIRPALTKGQVVLCDRFMDSTTAYQAAGRGLKAAEVSWLNSFATAGQKPDLTLVLDVDPKTGALRSRKRGEGKDRMEAAGLEFQARVRKAFKAIARKEARRVKLIDATRQNADEVFEEAWGILAVRLRKRGHGL